MTDLAASNIPPEWTPDSSSAACMICERDFTTLTRRRHHCRRCGLLVCHSCSKNTMIINGSTGERVCDGCYTTQLEKQEMKEERIGTQRRHEALMARGSHVSPHLIRVYFLDGTHKPIHYTNETTAVALTARVTSYRIAVFEVENDIDDYSHYVFVPPEERIVDLVSRWRLAGRNFAKLVIPLYSTHALHHLDINSEVTFHDRGDVQSPMRSHTVSTTSDRPSTLASRDNIASSLPPPVDTDLAAATTTNRPTKRNSPVRGPDLKSLSAELADLQQQHEQLKERYDVLRRQYRRLQGMREPPPSPRASVMTIGGGETERRSSLSASLMMMPAVTDRTSFGSGGLLVRPSFHGLEDDRGLMMYLGDEEDVGRRPEVDDHTSTPTNTSQPTHHHNNMGGQQHNHRHPASITDERDSLLIMRDGSALGSPSAYRFNKTDMGSAAASTSDAHHYRVLHQGFLMKRSDYKKQWNYRYCRLCSDGTIRYCGSDGETPKGIIRLRGAHQVMRSSQPLVIVLIFSNRRLKLKAEDAASFEKWLHALQLMVARLHTPQPPRVVEPDDSLVVEETETRVLTANQFLEQLEIVDDLITQYDCRILDTILDKGCGDPESLVDVYEIIIKMDSLYVKLDDLGPEWYERFKDWLTSLLRANLGVPLERADVVAVAMRCLANEGMLALPGPKEAVVSVIRRNLRQGVPAPSNIAQHGEVQENMALTRAHAILDFMRILVDTWIAIFPSEFQLGNLVYTEVRVCVTTDILDHYEGNKAQYTDEDLLGLLDWAERIRKTVDAFRVDDMSKMFRDVQATFLEAYCNQIKAQVEHLITRLIESQQVGRLHGDYGAALMAWPDDMKAFLEQQLDVVTARVPGEICGVVIQAILSSLPEFRNRLEQQVLKPNNKQADGLSRFRIMALCALVNDFGRFAETLEVVPKGFKDRLPLPTAQMLSDLADKDVTAFTEASRECIHSLADLICTEVESGLQAGLPGSWAQSVENPMVAMETKLLDAVKDIQPDPFNAGGEPRGLLLQESHFGMLLTTMLRRLVKFYVQLLMRVKPPVDEDRRLRQRLHADAKLLTRLFARFDSLPLPLIDDEVKPIVKVIALIDVDDVTNAGFIKTLLPVFGMPTTLKLIKNTLKMRGVSKEKRDKILEECGRLRVSGDWGDTPSYCSMDFGDGFL